MVYNLREAVPTRLSAGDILDYPYRIGDAGWDGLGGRFGGSVSIVLPKGEYLLECWGSASSRQTAQDANSQFVGTGGYAKGIIELHSNTEAILSAGGIPGNGGMFSGDYNRQGYATGSGGGSDIRLIQNDTNHRVIVAGGGGEMGTYSEFDITPSGNVPTITRFLTGGHGGGERGLNGVVGIPDEETYAGRGGTQTAGGVTANGYNTSTRTKQNGAYFQGGFWMANANDKEKGPGGGGWYGGGGGGYHSYTHDSTYSIVVGPGGGGSGFVWKSGASVPSGYALDSSYYLSDTVNITGHDEGLPIIEPDGSVSVGHFGEGHVRITVLSIYNGIYIGVNGQAKSVTDIYIGVGNVAKKVVKGYIGVNGVAKRFL